MMVTPTFSLLPRTKPGLASVLDRNTEKKPFGKGACPGFVPPKSEEKVADRPDEGALPNR